MFRVLSDPAIYEFENHPPESEEWLAHRYELLENRRSPDGTEKWLNWVVRLPSGEAAGYVQATVLSSGASRVAYELNSCHWRQGIGKCAVTAMLSELRAAYNVHTFIAVFKVENFRSAALLRSLGFSELSASQAKSMGLEADEAAMAKTVDPPANAT